MAAVYPSTALRSNQASVKRAANDGEVIITDNGGKHFLFLSEENYASELESVAHQAAYAERMAWSIRRAKKGIAEGSFVVGAEAAISAARQIREQRG